MTDPAGPSIGAAAPMPAVALVETGLLDLTSLYII